MISDIDAGSYLAQASSPPGHSNSKGPPPNGASGKTEEGKDTGLSTRHDENGWDGYIASDDPTEAESYQSMILDSISYLCRIPHVPDSSAVNKSSAEDSKLDEERELARASDRGWELLKDMEGHCMFFISGWWSYSFCYNSDVKQFHQLPPGRGGVPIFPPVEDPATPSYVLGRFDDFKHKEGRIDKQRGIEGGAEKTKGALEVAEMQIKGDMRYLVQRLDGGTTCDLTGKSRKIEVQFHCHPQTADRIGWIKEVTTCTYLMVIYTPRLCNDVAFLPPRENKAHPIVCREIVPENKITDWKAKKASSFADSMSSASAPPTSARPTVGDIELGGQRIVGSEGRRLEPPAPPKEQAEKAAEGPAEIVAKVDPNEDSGKLQKLSDKELKKMDLDPETVELLSKELQELAGEKAWRLEVVDVEGGMRELRGIVDGDEDGESEAGTEVEGEGKGKIKGKGKGASDEDDNDDAGRVQGVNENEAAEEGQGSEEEFKDEL